MVPAPSRTSRWVFAARAIAVTAIAVGVLVQVGWLLDLAALKSVVPGFVTMKANTALCFILAGVSLWIQCPGQDRAHTTADARVIAARLCAAIAACVGALTLIQYAAALDFGIDEILFRDTAAAAQTSQPGRMSPATAFGFVLMGSALLFLDAELRNGARPAELLAAAASATGLIAVLGYGYHLPALYRFYAYTSMALHTAVLLVGLGIGILLARPTRGLVSTVSSEYAGGALARTLLPYAVIVPCVLGWLAVEGRDTGYYETEVALALFAIATVVVLAIVVWLTARAANRSDEARHLADRMARETGERLAKIVDSAMDAVITIDAELRVFLFNAAAERIFRVDAATMLGQPLGKLLPERFHDALGGFVAVDRSPETAASPRAMGAPGDLRGLRADGEEFPIDASVSEAHIAGERFVTVILRDVTERNLHEERSRRAQRMEALGTLASSVAHDFNNILGAISGSTHMALADLPTGSPVREYLLDVQSACGRAADIVRRIATFGRGHDQPKDTIQLGPVIDEAVKLLRATIPPTIELRTRYAADAPSVLADSSQIHEVLMNLGANAAHAMAGRVGTLTFELDTAEVRGERSALDTRGAQQVRLFVTDTGCGMDKATRERAFEPFFTTKPTGKGTGLGLFAVHGIMASHGGEVTIDSAVGKGTCVSLCFPAAERVPPAKAATPPAVLGGGGRTVLLVDDDRFVCAVGKGLLTRMGYRVTAFCDPLEALAAFRSSPQNFDAAMLDRLMPRMTGEDLARELLTIRPDVPILMASGFATPEEQELALSLGVKDVIAKPYALDELSQKLHGLFVAQGRT